MKIMYITSGHYFYPHGNLNTFITRAIQNLQKQSYIFELNPNDNWFPKLLSAIKSFRPNFVFTIHGEYMNNYHLSRIKQMGVSTGIWCVDDPYDVDNSLPRVNGYDYIFTTENQCIPLYQSLNQGDVCFVMFGTQTQFYYPESPEPGYESDICLIGSPFGSRIEMIDYLIRLLTNVHFKLVGPGWTNYFNGRADIVDKVVSPDEIRKFYNGSRIVLNVYRKSDETLDGGTLNCRGIEATTPNVRTFDIAACKKFQLSTERKGLQDFFNLSSEVITYANLPDLVNKIDYYLRNAGERENVAYNAYYKTINRYRLENSLETMFNIVRYETTKARQLVVTPELLRAGKLYKGVTSPGVYWVLNGYKYAISSEEMLYNLGFCWENVLVVGEEIINQFREGHPL